MNKKRILIFLGLIVIMAALIVPSLLPHDKHTASQIPSVKEVQNAKTEQLSSAAVDKQKNQNQAKATVAVGDEKQQTGPAQAVKPAASSVPNASKAQGCQVGVAVVGIDGKLLYAPANVTVDSQKKWGITALGALAATGLPYTMKPTWPDFVDSIGEQACQGVAGWMYMVNGEVPMHLADKHPLKAGDQVIWWYSESMAQELPVWDKLNGVQQ